MLGNRAPEPRVVVQPVRSVRRRDRISSQDVAVVADEPVLQTGRVCHRRVELKEAARRGRNYDNVVERSISANTAADCEGGRGAGERLIDLPVVCAGVALLMRADEIPVGEIPRRRERRRANERVPPGVENADRLDDPDVRDQRPKTLVEPLLVGQYVHRRTLVDQPTRVVECVFDEEEVLLRFLLLDIERPQKAFCCYILNVSVGSPRGQQKQQQWDQQRRPMASQISRIVSVRVCMPRGPPWRRPKAPPFPHFERPNARKAAFSRQIGRSFGWKYRLGAGPANGLPAADQDQQLGKSPTCSITKSA